MRLELRREGGGGATGSSAGPIDCVVVLTRLDPVDGNGGGGAPPRAAGTADAPATLLVGTPGDDALLLHRTVRLGSFASPLEVRTARVGWWQEGWGHKQPKVNSICSQV